MLPQEDTLTREVSEDSPTQREPYVRVEGEATTSVPSVIAETHHPMMDDAGATTASSGSGGKNVGWEKPQLSTPWVETPTTSPDKGKQMAAPGPSAPWASRPPMSAINLDSSPVTVKDLTVLVETINQKWDGLATRLARMERHQHAAEQARSQPPPVEVKQPQGPAPAGHRPAMSNEPSGYMETALPTRQPDTSTAGTHTQPADSHPANAGSGYGPTPSNSPQDMRTPRCTTVDEDWQSELSLHREHIEQWDRKSCEAWQEKSDTYISLLAIAEYRRVTVGHESWYSESYAEASHVTSEMREALDRHNLSRPNEAERMRSAEGVRMGSDPGENISPPGHTTHQFTTQAGSEAY